MKLTYDKYRGSDVEWLGGIPAHWDVPSFRHVCRLEYGDSLPLEQREAGDVPVYGSNGVVGEHCDANTLAPAIIVGRKGSHGKVNFAAERAFAIDTTYFVDSRSTASSLRWLYYVLSSAGLDETSKDSAVPGLSRDDAYAMHLPLPPMDEQRSIGVYLDRETARIDELISMQESLIERLDEYRTALIVQAVTKGLPPEAAEDAGLDPAPKLKDSGVAWLGHMPEHWTTKRLALVVECLDSKRVPLNSEQRSCRQGTFPYWGANGVLDHVDDWLFDEPLILLGEDGAPFFARNKRVSFAVSGRIWVNNHAHVLRPVGIQRDFLTHLLNITDYAVFIDGSTRDKLTQGDMNDIPVLVPPQREQELIIDYLRQRLGRVDGLRDRIDASIERLLEYRSALITAAVTGKIDVRDAALAGAGGGV